MHDPVLPKLSTEGTCSGMLNGLFVWRGLGILFMDYLKDGPRADRVGELASEVL